MAFDHAIKGIKDLLSPEKLAQGLRHDLFYALLHRHTDGLENLGNAATGCNWITRTKGFNSSSVIYSAGVGKDISFEHALADRFGVTIQLLDPSPTALETMALPENQRPEFRFHPLALAGHSGELVLTPPGNPEEGSWASQLDSAAAQAATPGQLTVPCTTVGALMDQLGHREIDLLKIDIEGAEYGVLEAILSEGRPIRQIAVEYHNGILPGISRRDTIRSIMALHRAGYRIVFKGGSNHTLCLAGDLQR